MMISVLIPLYNCAGTVERAIQSAVSQKFNGEFELIVCDDGSTDASIEIVERVALTNTAVRLIRNSCNLGVSETRNRLVTAARGEWVAFLDADDIFLPGKLSRCVEVAYETDCDVVTHGLTYLTSSGTTKGSVGNAQFLQASLIKREMLVRFPFSAKLAVGEDGDFFSRLNGRAKVINIPDKLTGLSLRAESLTNKHWREKRLAELWKRRHRTEVPAHDGVYEEYYASLSWRERFGLERRWRSQKYGRLVAVHALNGAPVKAAAFAALSLACHTLYMRERIAHRK